MMNEKNIWFMPDAVTTELKGSTEKEIIEGLVSLLEKTGNVTDRNQVISDIMERQKAGSTFLCNEISVPHATSKGVSAICAAAGISENKKIYVIAVWPECTPHNLKYIAAMINFLNSEKTLKQLLAAPDNGEFFRIFENGVKDRL